MSRALRAGLRAAARNWGLTLLLLFGNVGLAGVLAVPLSTAMEAELAQRDAAQNMLHGFDYAWWSEWNEHEPGYEHDFGPELFGTGFVFRNLELLLSGQLPLRLFGSPAAAPGARVDGTVLALGALYLLAQAVLAGGVLGVLRAPESGWTVRGLLHGAGFYAGRMVRLLLLVLLVDGALFLLNVPFARWADARARESVSETAAHAWLFGRHALLLLALLAVNLLAGYAKAIVVVEERSSALLALVSSAGFCLRNAARVAGHYAAVALLAVLLLAGWSFLAGGVAVSGYRTQLLWLLLAQGLMAGRIFLRVALMGGQVALYEASA